MARAEADGVFHFRAGAPEGGILDGQLVAASEADALAQLKRAGYQPLRIERGAIRQSLLNREISWASSKVLPPALCEELCRELSILLGSGLELVDAVSLMTISLPKRSRLFKLALGLRQGLRLGRTFSESAIQSGFVFPSDFIPVVKAGEDSGALVEALKMLTETYRDSGRFSRVFIGALIYPAFLLLVAIATLGIIAFFVAPNLTGLFVSMDRPVPFAISSLSAASAFIAANVLPLSIVLAAIIAVIIGLTNNGSFRGWMLSVLFRTPGIGSALAWSASQKFASTLRLYVASNVAIASALPSAFIASGFPGARRRAALLAEDVRKGSKLSAALEKVRPIPPKVIHLIRVGENSGQLVEVLGAVAEEAKIRFEKRMTVLTALLAPALILLVGAFIGTIIYTIFSALLEVNNLAL